GRQRPLWEHLSWLGPGSVATGQPGSEPQPAAALGESLERRRGTGVRVSPPPLKEQVTDLLLCVSGRLRTVDRARGGCDCRGPGPVEPLGEVLQLVGPQMPGAV